MLNFSKIEVQKANYYQHSKLTCKKWLKQFDVLSDLSLKSRMLKTLTENFLQDEERVVKRFAESSDRGMIVEKRSVPLTGILHHLKRHLPVIVLTNARLLQCQTCAFSKTRARIRDCFAAACDITYQGHFVVLVGYDAATQLIYYANPSVGKTLCCSKYQHIDNARLCYGTDEDVIFIDEYR